MFGFGICEGVGHFFIQGFYNGLLLGGAVVLPRTNLAFKTRFGTERRVLSMVKSISTAPSDSSLIGCCAVVNFVGCTLVTGRLSRPVIDIWSGTRMPILDKVPSIKRAMESL